MTYGDVRSAAPALLHNDRLYDRCVSQINWVGIIVFHSYGNAASAGHVKRDLCLLHKKVVTVLAVEGREDGIVRRQNRGHARHLDVDISRSGASAAVAWAIIPALDRNSERDARTCCIRYGDWVRIEYTNLRNEAVRPFVVSKNAAPAE